jgi:hypothetical protein
MTQGNDVEKARAQLSQGVAVRPHYLARPAISWRISKNCFVNVSSRGRAQGDQCLKAVQGGNMAARLGYIAGQPDKLASCTQSLARAPPYSSYKYHHALPSKKGEESEVYPL